MAGMTADKAKKMLPSMQPTSLAPPSGDETGKQPTKPKKKKLDGVDLDDTNVEIAIPMG